MSLVLFHGLFYHLMMRIARFSLSIQRLSIYHPRIVHLLGSGRNMQSTRGRWWLWLVMTNIHYITEICYHTEQPNGNSSQHTIGWIYQLFFGLNVYCHYEANDHVLC